MTIVAGGIRRLALVRLDRIGDFLLWVNTARFYRRHFHEAEIVLFGNEAWADLALAMPYWDRFVPVRVSDENEPVVASDELPFGHFDVLLATQYSRTAAYDRFISGFQSIRKVAVNVQGPNLTESDYKHGNTFYSDLLDLDRAPKHELVRNFEFLNAITGADQAPELESLAPFLRPVRHELPDRYVAVFPGSTWSKKSYPWPRFVAICRMLKERSGLTSVLCGAADDKIIAANIHRNAHGATIDLTGVLDLAQSLRVIAGAHLVVANDSMAAHAANLLERPSVCILGGGYNVAPTLGATPIGRFFPYPHSLVSPSMQVVLEYPMPCRGCDYRCKYNSIVRDTIPCVEYIPLASVLAAVNHLAEPLSGVHGVIHAGANVGQQRSD